jgi:hypothetical protein
LFRRGFFLDGRAGDGGAGVADGVVEEEESHPSREAFMSDEWRAVPEPSFTGYYLDQVGRIWSAKHKKLLQVRNGRVVLSSRGIPRTFRVADLVLRTFGVPLEPGPVGPVDPAGLVFAVIISAGLPKSTIYTSPASEH